MVLPLRLRMRRIILLAMLALGLAAGPAMADFSEGQRRFAAGDYAGAYDAWRPLADAGDARAQYSLGVMHERGLGRPKDPEGAAVWFEKAARQGYAPATAALKAAGKPAPGAWGRPPSDAARIEAAVLGFFAQTFGEMKPGALRVTDAGSGVFDVAFEGALLLNESGYARIGAVRARVRRTGDAAWRAELAAPPELEGAGSGGTPFRVYAGGGRTAFTWDEQLGIGTDLDLDWSNVVCASDGPPVTIARLLIRSAMERAPGDGWRAPTDLRIEGLEVADAAAGSLRLESATVRTAMRGRNLERLARLVRDGPGEAPLDSLSELRKMFAEASFEFGLRGFRIEAPKGSFGLAEAGFSAAFSKLDQPAFDLAIGYGHAGLAGRDEQPIDALTPREARLKITLAQAPLDALLQVGIAGAIEYMLTGELSSTTVLLDRLRQELAAAGTRLSVDDALFQAAKARVTAGGGFAADRASVLGVVGALGVTVAGIDELIAASTRAEPSDGAMAKALAALARLGRPGPDGKTLTYRFELGAGGQTSVNGQPLARLLAPSDGE